MKRLLSVALLLWLAASCGPAFAAEKAQAAKKPPRTVRVLVLTGGHAFEEPAFWAMWDALAKRGIQYARATMPEDADLLKPGLEKQYDCVVRYDMCKTDLTPDQQKAFQALLETGIGLVSLHHNVGAHRGWDGYAEIIGGKYIFQDSTIEGRQYAKTPWSHDETLEIKVAAPQHPITRGVQDFTIHDETYGKFYVASDVDVLLTTEHPKNNREVAWTTQFGKSRIFYLMLGHDGKAYANPSFRRLVVQGIRWTAAGGK